VSWLARPWPPQREAPGHGLSNTVQITIEVGRGPRAIAWNPILNRVYVANSIGSSVSVLRDSITEGMEESRSWAQSHRPLPTITRGVLFLSEAAGPKLQAAVGRDWTHSRRPELMTSAVWRRGVLRQRGARGEGLGKMRKVVITR
jgi:hypothetical protein